MVGGQRWRNMENHAAMGRSLESSRERWARKLLDFSLVLVQNEPP
jgi:hypothetical protein